MEYDFNTVDQKLSEYIEQQNNQFNPDMTLEKAEKYFLEVSDFLSLTLGGDILYEKVHKKKLSKNEEIKLGYYNKVCDSCADALWLAGMYLLDELSIEECLVYSKMRREILDRMYDRSVSENDYLIKIANYFEYKIPPIGTTLRNEVERLAADSTIPQIRKDELLGILYDALSTIHEKRAKILYARKGLDAKHFSNVSLLWENINKKIELEQQTKVLEEEKR